MKNYKLHCDLVALANQVISLEEELNEAKILDLVKAQLFGSVEEIKVSKPAKKEKTASTTLDDEF
jgi:hypothetical protein